MYTQRTATLLPNDFTIYKNKSYFNSRIEVYAYIQEYDGFVIIHTKECVKEGDVIEYHHGDNIPRFLVFKEEPSCMWYSLSSYPLKEDDCPLIKTTKDAKEVYQEIQLLSKMTFSEQLCYIAEKKSKHDDDIKNKNKIIKHLEEMIEFLQNKLICFTKNKKDESTYPDSEMTFYYLREKGFSFFKQEPNKEEVVNDPEITKQTCCIIAEKEEEIEKLNEIIFKKDAEIYVYKTELDSSKKRINTTLKNEIDKLKKYEKEKDNKIKELTIEINGLKTVRDEIYKLLAK